MIQVSNTTAQTILPGQAVTFDKVSLHTGCGECFNRQVPTSVKLRGPVCSVYELHFNGNITSSTAGDVLQLSLAAAGTPLVETVMNATPAAAGTLVNVSTSTLFQPGCSDINRISVVNAGTTPITIAANSNFYIVRKS